MNAARLAPSTITRQLALRHHLRAAVGSRRATPAWIQSRIRLYARVAGVDVEAHTDPVAYGLTVARDVDSQWGEADRTAGRRRVFVNDSLGLTCGQVETVVAHEVGHHLMWSAGHRRSFFTRVQQLLDDLSDPDGGGP